MLVEKSRSILFCIMCRPPDSSKHLHKNSNADFANMLSVVNCENKEVILSRYLNCNYLIANDHKEIKDII